MFTPRPAWQSLAARFTCRQWRLPAVCKLVPGLILLLVSSRLSAAATAEKPYLFQRAWTTDKKCGGLPANAVTAVVQTHDGYLWFGTYNGLARFDWPLFKVFSRAGEPELQSDRITALYEDPRGTLWIGLEGGDLTSYRDGKFESQNVHETGERKKISAIGADDAGDIWVLSEEGTLLRVRDGKTWAMPNIDSVVNMARDGAGRLWVTSGGKLAVLQNGRLDMMTNGPDVSIFGSYIQGLCASRDGGLWVVGDSRVRKFDDRTLREDRGTNPCNVTVVVMLETHSGRLALGTSSDGLFLLATNRAVEHFNHASGFPNDWIRCLAEDREHNLWVGAGSVGVIEMRPGIIEPLNPLDKWHGFTTQSPAVARDGTLWVGSEGAGLYRYLNNEWKNYGESAGISNLYVWTVSQDAQGRIWAGTWGAGMFVQQGEHFVKPPGLENVNTPMAATLQATDGSTWIGTASGLIHYRHGTVTWYGETNGLKLPDVRTIAEAPDGTVWFGTVGGGLGRLDHGQLQLFQNRYGLSNDVQCLKFDASRALWIGTSGGGLNRLKNGHFSRITTVEGLPHNTICAIEDDDAGNFWISSQNGIFCVAQKSLNACADGQTNTVSGVVFGEGDGMTSPICSGGFQPASCKLADGRICFPTDKGLVVVNAAGMKINHQPPPVVIERVIVSRKLLARSPGKDLPLVIPPGQQGFEFHFTGLSYVAPEKMQFKYQLAGWDAEWVNADNDKRMASYSYLPPGSYTFHVRACNSDGTWNNDGASLAFIVQPHFWQTWWFRTLVTCMATALVVGIVLFITRRRMRHKLEMLQREQAIERERTRIAKDIHDHLGANLTRISLLSQSAHGELENPAQAATQLDRIYSTSRELTRSMDEIVWAVNPQHDTLDSLASYLGNFAQEYLVSINIRCRLEVPLHLPHWPITAEMRHNVFLAFKEALHNIVKHSGAREVSIFLTTETASFTLIIRDDGTGFDPAAAPERPGGGNGLKNLRQRLEKLGGQCEVNSTPGAGTEIKFIVFIPNLARAAAGR